jgi:hypothetical protein
VIDELIDGDLGPCCQPDALVFSKSASSRWSAVKR